MREIEFLPDWYPRTRQRKRIVVLQCWALGIVLSGFGAWITLAQRNVRAASAEIETLGGQLVQSQSEQRMLAEQLELRKELQLREQVIASLGYPVEMTRLLQTIDSVMPREMSLLDFSCNTEEQIRQPNIVAARAAAEKEKLVDRRLRVKLVGVAPSDVDLANFLAGLTNVPFFEQVSVTYARDKTDAGHIMREFEVTFSMRLDVPLGD